ncbi:hypothetical protein ACF0H5_004089 [Mactra antiquata]
MKYSIVFVILSLSSCLATVPRPRGVSISMASYYQPGAKFRCLDGTKEYPFEYVNDDYCDCPDGSDEPGTSACQNGKFHCTNAGYRPTNILSSRVNDGICDCCDGTDEWDGNIECVNNCKELGKKMREEADRVRLLQEAGYQKKLQNIKEGKQMREEKKVELEELQKSKVDLEASKDEMEARKNEAETPEKEAKEKHEQAWNELVELKKAEKEKLRAEIAFAELDTNGDSKIDVSEIKVHSMFDVDSNGEVSDEEALEHLEEALEADLEHFTLKVWPNIKDVYKAPGTESKGDNQDDVEENKASSSDIPEVEGYDDDDDYIDDDDDDDIDDEDDGYMDEEVKEDTGNNEEEDKMPDYDDETKSLIAIADEARQQFTEADNNLRDTENKIRDLESYLGNDYGPEDEYSILKDNCYEYTDREYTYKLCAYSRATQRPKNGGSETTLGNWGRWDGPSDDKYAAQRYENGQGCWNGPNRSVKVHFKCGTENRVTSASEPSRCEYAFDFETPSRCTAPPNRSSDDIHDEL